jgi:hypothetical protein
VGQQRRNGLIDALHDDGPLAGHTRELGLFGQFVGSWRLLWEGVDEAGQDISAHGELHFGWVLGGRAVQDTWIVPARGQPDAGRPPSAFHGTTVRFYDSNLGAWRSTWIEPVNGRVRRFIGRALGATIELISDEDEPQLRWTFSDITGDYFLWTGELSHDHGTTWRVEERMHARRSTPSNTEF